MMDRQPLVRSFVLLFFVLLSAPCPPAVGGFFFFFFFLALLPPHTTTDLFFATVNKAPAAVLCKCCAFVEIGQRPRWLDSRIGCDSTRIPGVPFLSFVYCLSARSLSSASAKSEGRAHQLTIAREGRQRIDNQVGRQLTPLSRAEIGCSLGSGMRQN
ncbi:hypothetical protein IWX47DRAFT_273998 [Phyllosticta citricarpa]